MKSIFKNKYILAISIIVIILICIISLKVKRVLKDSLQNMTNYSESLNQITNKIKENADSINNINNAINSLNDSINKQLNEINDSLTNSRLSLIVNGDKKDIKLKYDKNTYNVNTLNIEFSTKIKFETTDNLRVFINGEEVDINTEIEIKLDELSNDNKINFKVTDINNEDYREYTINTLPSEFPKIEAIGRSQYEGDYYIDLSEGLMTGRGYAIKLNSDGKILYYKQNNYPINNFRKNIIGDKIRYTYFEGYERKNGFVGSILGEVVVLNEKYEEIDRVILKKSDKIAIDTMVDQHDYIILDDKHYLVLSYIFTNPTHSIEESDNELKNNSKVIAAAIQEIKDDEVIWEWISTDYPELYDISSRGNEYSNINEWADYTHINSIFIDPKDNNLICSMRNLDSVLKLNRTTGEIMWILGGKGDQFNLTDDQKFNTQHNATILENGNLLLFDNDNDTKQTRFLEFKIDEEKKEIISFDEYKLEGTFSEFCGSVQKIDEDNNVFNIGWGLNRNGNKAVLSEVDFNKNIVNFEILVGDNWGNYRCYKIN